MPKEKESGSPQESIVHSISKGPITLRVVKDSGKFLIKREKETIGEEKILDNAVKFCERYLFGKTQKHVE